MVTEFMGPISPEQKSNNYEHAHELAIAIADEFLKKYDLSGHGIEETTGAKYDSGMDFWSYEMFQNNKGEKPKSKEEVVVVFEEMINDIFKQDKDLDKVYNFFVLHDDSISTREISLFKQSIYIKLQQKFQTGQQGSDKNFPGFDNVDRSGTGRM